MSDKIYLIIIALLLGYIVFLTQCSAPELVEVPGEPVEIIVRDTVTVKDTVIVEGPRQIVEIEVPVPDTSGGISTYRQPYSDSYLSGTFSAKVRGTLLGWGFDYVPRTRFVREHQFTNTFTTISTPVYVQQRPSDTYLLLGGGLGGNLDKQSFHGLAGIERGDYIYTYKYDLLLKTHKVSVMRKFSF